MLQLLKSDYKALLRILHLSISDPQSELEAVFKPKKSNQPFTRSEFENIFRRLKSLGMKCKEEEEHLDISINETESKIYSNNRITLKNIGAIKEYCEKNSLDGINNTQISYIKKNRYSEKKSGSEKRERIMPLHINDYNFRINLNHEQNCRKKEIEEINQNFSKKNKSFRLKKRYSFTSKDKLFRFDLSIIKTSKQDRRGQYVYARDLQSSGLMDNIPLYEFEIEFIGHKMIKTVDENERIDLLLNNFISNIGIILQVIRNTYHIISNTEERKVLQEYCTLVSGKKVGPDDIYNKQYFIGPKNVSLEKMNIVEIDEDDTSFNIRKDYCVTDKADGERHLLFISKSKKIYLINNRFEVVYTGMTANNYSNSIMDGELITKTNLDNNIFRMLIFDLYFIQGQDIRNRQLNRSEHDKKMGIEESRLEQLSNLLSSTKLTDVNQGEIEEVEEGELEEDIPNENLLFSWKMKDFYYGDIGVIGNKIFTESKILLDKIDTKGFNYETDGLIYTPVKLPVGGYVEGVSSENTGITWNACFKWKPPQDNTIDFLVNFLKEKNEQGILNDKISYKIENNELGESKLVKYKTLILKTGYNPTQYEKINPCVLINEGKEYIERKKRYVAKEFTPENPYDENAYIANIEITTDSKGQERILCYKTGDEIEDDTIVEMSYDNNEAEGFKWKPRNVRYDKTMERRLGYTQFGNDFKTAQSIWSSYHNPITKQMISNGNGIELEEYDSDIYYSRVIERGKSFTKPLIDFHNSFVKSKLIETVSEIQGIQSTLLDLACGKAGDLHKWINSKLRFVLGIDISSDNIENPKDGACVRYYGTKQKYIKMDKEDEIPEIIFSAGDTSKNIHNGQCTDNESYKQLLRVIFGDPEIKRDELSTGMQKIWKKADIKFDICSIQFALHYYFKDIETLRGLLNNISRNTKVNGYFIATCFDGKQVFDKLKHIKKGDYIEGYIDRNRVWKIKKEYDNKSFNNDISSLGMQIGVYMETINQMFREYLVNFDLLINIMKEYGFELEDDSIFEPYGIKSTGLFSELYENMIKSGREYKDATKMTIQEKEISFLNRYFIFKKNDVPIKTIKKKKTNKKIIIKSVEG